MCPVVLLALLLPSVSSFSAFPPQLLLFAGFTAGSTRRAAREERWERRKHGKNRGMEQEKADSTDSDELHTRQQHAHYAAHGLPLKKYGLPATKSQWEKQLVKDGIDPDSYDWERTHYSDIQRVHFLEQEREKKLRDKRFGNYSEAVRGGGAAENVCRGCGGRNDAFLSGACSRSCAERCLYCSLDCPACWGRAKTQKNKGWCCEDVGVSCTRVAGTMSRTLKVVCPLM